MEREEFYKWFYKCPICGKDMQDVTEPTEMATRLFACLDCEILVGRFT